MILDKTYQLLQEGGRLEKKQVHYLRSCNTIASNLERIADFSVNMLRQAEHLTDLKFLNEIDYQALFEEIMTGLENILEALDRRQGWARRSRICQAEFNLDELYAANFNNILAGLRAGGHAGNLVTCLMILHYLERMGDSLLNIGEAIIFALVGERMKIQQYKALTESLSASGLETPISDVEFESIWGTRSGCRIARGGGQDGTGTGQGPTGVVQARQHQEAGPGAGQHRCLGKAVSGAAAGGLRICRGGRRGRIDPPRVPARLHAPGDPADAGTRT